MRGKKGFKRKQKERRAFARLTLLMKVSFSPAFHHNSIRFMLFSGFLHVVSFALFTFDFLQA